MTLLICNSNLFVPVVLTKILSNQEKQFLVLVDQDCLKIFFESLNLLNVILINTKNPSYKNLYSTKKKLLHELNRYKISDIFFFHDEYGDISNWIIHKYSSKANIYHGCVYDTLPNIYDSKSNILSFNFKYLKLKLIYKLMFQTDIDPIFDGAIYVPSLSKKFFDKNNIHNIDCNSDLTIIAKYISNKFIIDKDKILLLTGSVVASHLIDGEIYTQYINNIISAIGEKKIISKCHPRFNDLFGKECDLQQIPSFIPGNLIINNFEYFIGYNSTLLVEAAVSGKKAISLIDLIPPINSQTSQYMHTFLSNRLKGKGLIYYPKNIEELLSYIN